MQSPPHCYASFFPSFVVGYPSFSIVFAKKALVAFFVVLFSLSLSLSRIPIHVGLPLLPLAGEVLVHSSEVVVNRVDRRGRRLGAVHALAQLALYRCAADGVVACRSPACCFPKKC